MKKKYVTIVVMETFISNYYFIVYEIVRFFTFFSFQKYDDKKANIYAKRLKKIENYDVTYICEI